MDRFQRYGNLLKNDGTNQLQRLSPALEPDYILPDERSLSDLLTYARELAAQIRFYSLTGQSTGDWQPFLEALVADAATGSIYDVTTLENLLNSRRDWPPHLVLFIVFLKLFETLQSDLNELPQRHLRHYYEQELHLLRREAQADAVHIIFELARNAAPTLIPANTLLDAGKDGEGRPLYYATQADRVVNAAQVSDIRRLVGETDRRGFQRFFVADTIAEQEGESWYTFGRQQLDLDPSQRFMTDAQIGFAIASPILLMAEGERILKISARLRSDAAQLPVAQGLDAAFTVDLTGAEGWLTPNTTTAALVYQAAVGSAVGAAPQLCLEMTLTLAETAPAVVTFDPELHGEGPAAACPVVRCRLNSASGYYATLTGLVTVSATLTTTVRGVKNLVVQNSQGVLTPDQPMPLFSTQPRLGSPFYIGSAEVFSKQLTSLTVSLDWQDLPEGEALFDHYRAYFDAAALRQGLTLEALRNQFRGYFSIFFDLLYNRQWHALLPGDRTLFEDGSTRQFEASQANFDTFAASLGNAPYKPQPQLGQLDSYRTTTKFGFVRLTLQGLTRSDTGTAFEAFGHQLFPARYATQAIALSRRTADSPGDDPELPNEPITPTLAGLRLDYTASVEMVPGDLHSPETFFRLEPFGYAAADTKTSRLVPELDNGFAAAKTDADVHLGVLYIGLANFIPPANISLFFQIDRGTATATTVLTDTEWSYLRGDRWTVLPPTAILNDSTSGFQESGIVVLAMGRDASIDHTLMPHGQVWLRAMIHKSPTSAARTASLQSQAVTATFAPTVDTISDYCDHLQAGLAAETIQRLKRRLASIKTIQQPAASFGGRASETDTDFFRRCSERLRHRHRAVTTWDFERLVLEAFPEIFKVKCLPHSDARGQPQAGEVAIVVVPNVQAVPSLEPRAGAVLIRRIHQYVNTHLATPFAKIHVIHPTYERIRIDARVAFRLGLDAGYYASVLNEDLQRFLSPWAYKDGEDIVFGGQIYRSEILAFMEGRDYVDYITDFNLYHSHVGPKQGGIGDLMIGVNFLVRADPQPPISPGSTGMVIGDTFVVGSGVEVATATRPQTILVSHIEHRITPINGDKEPCPGVKTLGIGYMTVQLDFDVANTQ